MKRVLLYCGIMIIGGGLCWGIYYSIFRVRHMPFQFECTMATNENTYTPWRFHYVSTEKKLCFWIYDNQSTESLPPLIENLDLSTFNFTRYDYLLFVGERLTDLCYSPWLSHTNDAICRHEDSRIPLIPTVEEASPDSLYIYKIYKTTKFREPGP